MEEIIGEQKCHYQVPQEQPPQTPAQKNTVADPALNGIREQLTVHTCQSRSDFFPVPSLFVCFTIMSIKSNLLTFMPGPGAEKTRERNSTRGTKM